MLETMAAAVLHGSEDLRMERIPVPHAAPGEIVVRIGAALTCGTDLKVYRRGYHAMMLKPPPGTIMLASWRGSAGSATSPGTIAFSLRMKATSAA